MNCKPGDLAIIVDAPAGSSALGLIVNVLRAADPAITNFPKHHTSRVSWWVSASRPVRIYRGSTPGRSAEFIAPDESLRPIRDPGDDAVDEFAREREVTA